MGLVPHSKTAHSPYRVQVLDRALALLDCIGAERRELSLSELCRGLNLHKSTVHRLVMVLERHRLVEKNPETSRYRLGIKLFELGSKSLRELDLRDHARPYLARLMRDTEETVNLCILDGTDVLYIEKMESQRNLRMASAVGHRFPACCTALGKAILAELPRQTVLRLIKDSKLKKRTRNTLTTAAALLADLDAVRIRGYSIDNEENEEGARCVGAAVHDHSGRPIAAISVSGPAFRMSKVKVAEVGQALTAAAAELSADLGYRGSPANMITAAAM
ncbi:MAG TPA: IclR family transcriptional regulator [Candidatus Acidoferrales bacterium]|nr:IclR family transcriptional regulator [Candidatus Acidoferrales bacterium]